MLKIKLDFWRRFNAIVLYLVNRQNQRILVRYIMYGCIFGLSLAKPLTLINSLYQEHITYVCLYIWVIDQACSVAGYWPSSFFTCLWTETESIEVNKLARKLERGDVLCVLQDYGAAIRYSKLKYSYCSLITLQ